MSVSGVLLPLVLSIGTLTQADTSKDPTSPGASPKRDLRQLPRSYWRRRVVVRVVAVAISLTPLGCLYIGPIRHSDARLGGARCHCSLCSTTTAATSKVRVSSLGHQRSPIQNADTKGPKIHVRSRCGPKAVFVSDLGRHRQVSTASTCCLTYHLTCV